MTKIGEKLIEAVKETAEVAENTPSDKLSRAQVPLKSNPLAADGLPMLCRECLAYSGTLLNGICRGCPPTPAIIGAVQTPNGVMPRLDSFWPMTAGDEWCLSFTPDRDKVLQPILADMPEVAGSA